MLKPKRDLRAAQMHLFHQPHRPPPWTSMPAQVQQEAAELIAQLLGDHVRRHCRTQRKGVRAHE